MLGVIELLIKYRSLFKYGMVVLLAVILWSYIRHLNSKIDNYQLQISNQQKEISVLKSNISELNKKYTNLQKKLAIIQSTQVKLSKLMEDNQVKVKQMQSIIPSNKLRVSYDKQKEIINQLNNAIDSFNNQ